MGGGPVIDRFAVRVTLTDIHTHTHSQRHTPTQTQTHTETLTHSYTQYWNIGSWIMMLIHFWKSSTKHLNVKYELKIPSNRFFCRRFSPPR